MASRWGAALACACGLTYTSMRTGDTFASIRDEMRSGSDDPADWRYRRRGGVLGFWHAKKLAYWRYHVAQCEDAQEPDDEAGILRRHPPGEPPAFREA